MFQPTDETPDLTRVENALASLKPRASHLDRDQLMFLAGQASVATRRKPAALRAAGLVVVSLLSALSGLSIGMNLQPGGVNQMVDRPGEIKTAPAEDQEKSNLAESDPSHGSDLEIETPVQARGSMNSGWLGGNSYLALRRRAERIDMDIIETSANVSGDLEPDAGYLKLRNHLLEHPPTGRSVRSS